MIRTTWQFCFTLLILFVFPFLGHAQFGVTSQLLNPSQIVMSPQYPEPGASVTLSLNDYSINTAGAKIDWYIDGTLAPAAQNQRSLRITAGALGTPTTVTAKTTLPSGSPLTSTITLTPVRVDLLVEADTLTPAFYAGRSLPSSGSLVRVTAVPFTGTNLAPNQYSYKWTVGGTIEGGGSQYGKNSVTFRSNFERSMEVAVEVIDASGMTIAKRTVNVPIVDPELHFYAVNPLSGESRIALSPKTIFAGEEMRVRAEPYYMDRLLMTQKPYVQWKLNGQTIDNPSEDTQEITLRKQGGRGSFNLEFQVRNLQNVLQGVKDDVQITF